MGLAPDMASNHFPAVSGAAACTELVSPRNSGLKLLEASLVRLNGMQPEHTFQTGGSEFVLNILAGSCTVHLRGPSSATYPEIGTRSGPFAGKPTMVYIPRSTRVEIYADTETMEALLFSAPARKDGPAALVYPEEAQTRIVGKDNWQRTVITSIGENVKADRLIVGETVNPPGNWSSAPPHKHDVHQGAERPMEEVYYYRLNPPQGFGLQRLYTAPGAQDPLDETYVVRDGDLVVLPRGYHPVVAAPGYQLLYVWALAGEERSYGAWTDDPDHAWIKGS